MLRFIAAPRYQAHEARMMRARCGTERGGHDGQRMATAAGFAARGSAGRHGRRPVDITAGGCGQCRRRSGYRRDHAAGRICRRSEEHTSELQSLMRISYAVFCLKKKKHTKNMIQIRYQNK